jgi:hypothetical protein
VKISVLRLLQPCFALKCEDVIAANDNVSMELLQNGGVVVRGFREDGKPVYVPVGEIKEAVLEDKPKVAKAEDKPKEK